METFKAPFKGRSLLNWIDWTPEEIETLVDNIPMVKESMVYATPEDDGDVTISVKVVYDEDYIKEKFGTLRFYYSVLCDSEERTDAQEVMIEYLEAEADKIIREAEDECYNTCEECGSQIGTDWSPRCETSGWIRYICSRCAETIDKCGYVRTYFKNGAKYQGKTLLQTKEEVDAEHRAIEAKYEAEHDVVHEDDDDEEAVAKKFTEDIMKELHNNENA